MEQSVLDSLYGDLPMWDKLLRLMALLRSPEGCPWDRGQTHLSIRKNLTEECGELLEAIDAGDDAMMREELGDVLLQVVFHARIAEEEGRFTIGDVLGGLCDKLITRHPHVFGGVKADSEEEALAFWQEAKAREKYRDGPAAKAKETGAYAARVYSIQENKEEKQ
ncbi:MAG: nucleotide pyrophosphohydrolase [Oscillospiraceae bacterium]|jgi:tetrapyrrole methylase family protein/MazG family protein|nr:nucleotide pyrophosphohydrolase [Oscillospiraceae bacterium]